MVYHSPVCLLPTVSGFKNNRVLFGTLLSQNPCIFQRDGFLEFVIPGRGFSGTQIGKPDTKAQYRKATAFRKTHFRFTELCLPLHPPNNLAPRNLPKRMINHLPRNSVFLALSLTVASNGATNINVWSSVEGRQDSQVTQREVSRQQRLNLGSHSRMEVQKWFPV